MRKRLGISGSFSISQKESYSVKAEGIKDSLMPLTTGAHLSNCLSFESVQLSGHKQIEG
jgi:hypothetical protein